MLWRCAKVRGFIWMLAYKENHVLSASKPGKERLAQHQRYHLNNFRYFRYLNFVLPLSRLGIA